MTVSRDDIDGIQQLADAALIAVQVGSANADTIINKIRARAQLALLANIAIDIRVIRGILEEKRTG